ncbi:uncharacterized protein LOC143305670 [Osmia lignaria lignaria]|uniref:uncharacterized protein LOC143305670 n=1 Tax=Osmia lignaria lignaria TaxID=1437193 RepID=UPI00402B06B1
MAAYTTATFASLSPSSCLSRSRSLFLSRVCTHIYTYIYVYTVSIGTFTRIHNATFVALVLNRFCPFPFSCKPCIRLRCTVEKHVPALRLFHRVSFVSVQIVFLFSFGHRKSSLLPREPRVHLRRAPARDGRVSLVHRRLASPPVPIPTLVLRAFRHPPPPSHPPSRRRADSRPLRSSPLSTDYPATRQFQPLSPQSGTGQVCWLARSFHAYAQSLSVHHRARIPRESLPRVRARARFNPSLFVASANFAASSATAAATSLSYPFSSSSSSSGSGSDSGSGSGSGSASASASASSRSSSRPLHLLAPPNAVRPQHGAPNAISLSLGFAA